MDSLKTLLNPISLNPSLTLKNRIAMSPMTRNLATDEFVPTKAMAEYYARRADAGLIITEGTVISPDGRGYSNTPAIYSKEQITGWSQVTDAVHQNNGLIFCQIWHVGRASHPHFLNGKLPVSASATTLEGRIHRTKDLQYGKSRAATVPEITSLVERFQQAAKNAIEAGFDGVEIHAANGYLIDQFLHYDTNHRTDNYGGSPENMARFALEIVSACGEAIGYERVSIRLSPGAYFHMKGDPRDAGVFQYLLKQLNNKPIAFVHNGNFDDSVTFAELNNLTMSEFMRQYYQGHLMACGSYTIDSAIAKIDANQFDLVSFGRPFIANPDLISKLENKDVLVDYDSEMLNTLY